jgi:hypothetical protein
LRGGMGELRQERQVRRWEYKKLVLNEAPRRGDEIDLLCDAGEEGWELVAVLPNGVAYMKREVEEPVAWSAMGLKDVVQTALTIRMDFASFADYWTPWLKGQGTVGAYLTGLDSGKLAQLEQHLRRAYLAGADDGPRSFAATAWVVRGIV